MLDIGDNNNETALIQAVKYQQEECATILLDNGAYPDVANLNGNTALHYAVLGHNMAIVEKLLSCGANLEVKNRDGLTPLSLAQRENKKEVVSLLLNSGAALPTVNEMESNQQQTSDNEEERRPETCSEKRNLDTDLQESPKTSRETNFRTVDKSSEEVSLRRNPGRDNSLALSVDEDCKVLYEQKGFHSLPYYLNLLNNLILWWLLPPAVDWRQYGLLYTGPVSMAIRKWYVS
ncbi:uncharacterized protein WM277_011133 [Molossus nigricans]